jgi:hypothetical protein
MPRRNARVLAATAVAGIVMWPAVAAAQVDPYGGGSSVPGSATASTMHLEVAPTAAPQDAALPLTGGDVVALTAVAVGAVAGGLGIAAHRRRVLTR